MFWKSAQGSSTRIVYFGCVLFSFFLPLSVPPSPSTSSSSCSALLETSPSSFSSSSSSSSSWNEGKILQRASIFQFTDKGNDLCKLPVQLLDFSYQLGYDFDMLLQVREFAGCALLLLRTAARDADVFMVVPAVSTKFTFPNKVVPAASDGLEVSLSFGVVVGTIGSATALVPKFAYLCRSWICGHVVHTQFLGERRSWRACCLVL